MKDSLARLGIDSSSRVLVVGLGSTGLSVVSFLTKFGIELAVADSRQKPPELESLREHYPDVGVFLNGFDADVFARATHLIVSPGVAIETPEIKHAQALGAIILGDLDLFACEVRAPVLAITGANGKSTVTSLLGLMAECDGLNVKVGGNLGTPMLDCLDDEAELYVIELSSFQLERSLIFNAKAATVLNISPDHMDRYADIEAYAGAKHKIFNGNGLMVLNHDDERVRQMAEPGRQCVWFGIGGDPSLDYRLDWLDGEEWLIKKAGPLMRASEVRIKGRHNLSNSLAALALGDAVGLSDAAMIKALKQFAGLEHRMQWVADIRGVTWINDSKATNIGACIAALQGLNEKVVLIAGGDGKGADFSPLASIAKDKLRAAVLMGRDAPLLEAVLKPVVETVRVSNMKQAVEAAFKLAQKGEVVLLAPACASLDQYKNYQERGKLFSELAKGLPA